MLDADRRSVFAECGAITCAHIFFSKMLGNHFRAAELLYLVPGSVKSSLAGGVC